MTTPILIKSFLAAEAIGPHLIVKAGAADGQVNIGVDSEDPLLGVSDALGADAGKMADVTQVGWGEVKAGGTFAFGDQLTCDDEGRAIKAVPTAGKTIRTPSRTTSFRRTSCPASSTRRPDRRCP